MVNTLFMGICGAAALTMAVYYITRCRRLRSLLYGSVTGLAALIVLAHYGNRFGLFLPLNAFNLSGSAVLGVPFVICQVILKIL